MKLYPLYFEFSWPRLVDFANSVSECTHLYVQLV